MEIRILIFLVVFMSLVLACNKEEKPFDVEEKDPTISHTIISNPGDGVEDIDENFYETIVLGNGQEWMAENLKTSKCSDGTEIPYVENETNWDDIMSSTWNNITTPAWTYYYNNEDYKEFYGKLYNGYSIKNCDICPNGWHIPSKSDWESLIDYLGGQNVAGSKMKSTGPELWSFSNEKSTNESGFTAYPSGRIFQGVFQMEGSNGFWWSSTEQSEGYLWSLYLDYSNEKSQIGSWEISSGFSVRCIKN